MECEVVDNYETETFDNFICKITNTYVDEDCLTGQGTDPEMMDILQKFIFGEICTRTFRKPAGPPVEDNGRYGLFR